MTCKDCLHFEACESMLRAMGYQCDGDGADADERCDTFADRSRHVVREKGEWGNPIKVDADNNGYKCSECGEFGAPCWSYCPNCGADMRKGENG